MWVCLVAAAGMPATWAQSANCESFRQRVAASIEAKGIRDYSLEFVPRRDPRPAGARVVGNCDGGAYSLLYRRGAAATAATPEAEAASGPAPQPYQSVAPSSRAASKPAAATAAATKMATATAPSMAPAPKGDAPRDSPAAAPAAPALSVAIAPASPATAPQAPPIEHTAPPMPAAPGAAAVRPNDPAPSTFDVVARRLAWLVAGVLVVGFGMRLFRRWRHRRYYDDAGLPRGPRITL
jgi:hypothetical protein